MTLHSLPSTWNFRIRIVSGTFRAFILSLLMAAFSPIQLQGKTVAYVANSSGNSVSIIDVATNTVTATIPVGRTPYGIVFSPDGRKAYVSNAGSASISVIDTATNSVTDTISVGGGAQPAYLAITPDGNNLYVPSHTGDVRVVNIATRSVTATIPMPTPYPAMVVIPSDGQKAYVQCNNVVVVISTATNSIVKLLTDSVRNTGPGLGILPSGSKVYVARGHTGSVDVINTSSGNVTSIPTAAAVGISVGSDGSMVYASHMSANTVSAIRSDANGVAYTVSGFNGPQGLAATPDGAFLYVANTYAATVSVVNTSTHAVVKTIPVGSAPVYVAIANVS